MPCSNCRYPRLNQHHTHLLHPKCWLLGRRSDLLHFSIRGRGCHSGFACVISLGAGIVGGWTCITLSVVAWLGDLNVISACALGGLGLAGRAAPKEGLL
jgi:hypothetical protein